MSLSIKDVLEYTQQTQGIVLRRWVKNPNGCKQKAIVFPTQLRRPSVQGVGSKQIREFINTFYPHVGIESVGSHSLFINTSSGSILLLESNLDIRSEFIKNGNKLEYPSYPRALKTSCRGVFLGVSNILIQSLEES
jgi:hypothetical protein